MIDLDAIRDTTEVVVGQALPGWLVLALAFAPFAMFIAVAVSTRLPPDGGDSDEARPHPAMWWALAAPAGVIPLFILKFTVDLDWMTFAYVLTSYFTLLGVGAVLASLRYRAKIDSAAAPEETAARERRLAGRGLEASVTGTAIAALALVASIVATPVPVTEEVPTAEAMVASQDAFDRIRGTIPVYYDVELLDAGGCVDPWANDWREADDDEIVAHGERVTFVEAALSDDPDDAATVRVVTRDGIVACYDLLYSTSSGHPRLLIDGDRTDLPAPGTLTKRP
ncbi:MAG: hypothetical protein ACTH0V_00440 [Microbacteriaceae bacterium]